MIGVTFVTLASSNPVTGDQWLDLTNEQFLCYLFYKLVIALSHRFEESKLVHVNSSFGK